MHTTAAIIFALTYLGIALGEVPGLVLDRTGIALLGAIAMVALGVVPEKEAVLAIDMPTILLLYGLMVISAQFRLGGFYTHVAVFITRTLHRPRLFLLAMMCASAGLSAVLANDIVCLAFTPVIAVALMRAGMNPVPYLLGLACASNIGSAATIIGNPQNMVIGQVGGLHFARFFAWCAAPSALALGAAYASILLLHRGQWRPRSETPGPAKGHWPAYNRHQSNKGLLVTLALMAFFFTPVPREVSAIAAAGVLLCSRKMSTRSILGLVDWHLITLFCGLFVVVKGIELTHWPERMVETLGQWGIDLGNFYLLGGVSVALSNVVSNVPAAMLLVKFLDPSTPVAWYVLAVSSTFAGNLITIGSIANLITIEQAKSLGVNITFRDHARVGVPVTLVSLAVLALWIAVAG
jgi:Na+/H+ antiporter NhaD/arsenite permease-like protein